MSAWKGSLLGFVVLLSLGAGEIPVHAANGGGAQGLGAESRSPMDPHRPPSRGPWFEGWYTRITDEDGKRSVAVLVASQLPEGVSYRAGDPLKGYLLVLVGRGDGSPLEVHEKFLESTRITRRSSRHSESDRPDFEWFSLEAGSVTQDRIQIRTPDGLRLDADFAGRLPWDPASPGSGPEGLAAYMKVLPLHWFVHSLGSAARYEVSTGDSFQGGIRWSSKGYAHQEKNWGSAFPSAWIWLQGVAPSNDARVVVSGGNVEMGPVLMHTWMAAYQSARVTTTFSPAQVDTTFTDAIDPCQGGFYLRAKNPEYEMVLRAQAPLESFGSMSVPMKDGFLRNGSKESFVSRIEVTIRRNDFWSAFRADNLVERRVFENAALEFGAGYQKCAR